MQITKILAVSLALSTVSACGQSDDGHSADSAHHSNATHNHGAIDGLYWPPQLDGMSNQQALPSTARSRARNSVLAAARSSLLNNPEVREALGPTISEYNATLGDPKGDATASFVYYNYSSDQTVEVTLKRDGSIALQTFDASQFQPTENSDDIASAINLAKTTLESGGYITAGLTGTAMLAYPPANKTQNLSDIFYPQRVLYVTFGSGDGELPDYSALVNLSTATVSEFGTIK